MKKKKRIGGEDRDGWRTIKNRIKGRKCKNQDGRMREGGKEKEEGEEVSMRKRKKGRERGGRQEQMRKQKEDEGRWRRDRGKEGRYGGRGRIKEGGRKEA